MTFPSLLDANEIPLVRVPVSASGVIEVSQSRNLPLLNRRAFRISSGAVRDYTVNTFPLDAVAAGTTDIVAAAASMQHVLMRAVLSFSAAATVKFQDDAGTPVVIVGAMSVLADTVIEITAGSRACTTNQKLQIVTTGGSVSGYVEYLTVDA